ncbi:MAG: hypothetical protein R3D88_08730 [Alphaproteobacteria bacterium]
MFTNLAHVDGLDPIQVIGIDTLRPDGTTKQHGVAWHVNGSLLVDVHGKVRMEKSFFGWKKKV